MCKHVHTPHIHTHTPYLMEPAIEREGVTAHSHTCTLTRTHTQTHTHTHTHTDRTWWSVQLRGRGTRHTHTSIHTHTQIVFNGACNREGGCDITRTRLLNRLLEHRHSNHFLFFSCRYGVYIYIYLYIFMFVYVYIDMCIYSYIYTQMHT